MKKPLFAILILGFALSACLPTFLQQPEPVANTGEAPQVNIQETAAAMAGTIAAQTIAALPTSTLVIPSKVVAFSPTPTVKPDISATTLLPTPTATATVATSTATIIPPTPTQTPTIDSGIATPTTTLHVRFYGTLPPSLPYGFITLSNKSKVEAYISLQCKTPDGYTTIMEYPVKGTFDVKVPAGKYEYVAWVGGKEMIGRFSLGKRQELIITLYKSEISIK